MIPDRYSIILSVVTGAEGSPGINEGLMKKNDHINRW